MKNKAGSTAILLTFLDLTLAQFNFTECGVSKSCVYSPPSCQVTRECRKVVSYTPPEDGWTTIELFYNETNPDTNYAAIGFSEDNTMGNDAVSHCGFSDDGNIGVFLSYNPEKSNDPVELNRQDDFSEYIELLQASHGNTHIYCKFRQLISPGEDAIRAHIPNLNRSYTLLLAYGKTSDYKKADIHSLDSKSKDFPTVLASNINVANLSVLPDDSGQVKLQPKKGNRTLVLIHGILMIVAWLWLIATAISSARYLRDHFPHTTPMGLKIWFHIHRTLNSIAVLVAIIAVLLIFIGKDWRWTGPAAGRTFGQNTSPGAVHSILGAIAVCLLLTQPIGALLRCSPDSRARPIFNWVHRSNGLVAYFLAFVALIIAVAYFHVWSSRVAAVVLIAVYALLLVLLIALAHLASTIGDHQMSTITYEPNGSSRGERINVITKGKDSRRAKAALLLLVSAFFILSTVITIAMILVIVL